MEIAAILLTLGVTILVGLYLYAPLLERRALRVTEEEHELSALMAERDRVVNSLQELDFDFKLGKIPEDDYPVQRASLLQRGADILRKIDTLHPAVTDTPSPSRKSRKSEPTNDELESLIIARRKSHKAKSAGFCPKCGKPVTASDRFCPSCGKAL